MLSDLEDNYLESLTKREMEVLRLLETGASNQEIADTLVVEVSTVKWYNSQLYEKLQVKNPQTSHHSSANTGHSGK